MIAQNNMEQVQHSAFPQTDWDMVDLATQPNSDHSFLGRLLTAYLPSLELYVIGQFCLPPDQAKDLLQNFVLQKIIEKDLLQSADRQRGKFRNFIIRSLHNFVIEQIRRDQAVKRSPSHSALPIHELPESCLSDIKPHSINKFDIAWARDLLTETLRIVREECLTSGRVGLWGVFEARLLKPLIEETEPTPYEDLVQQFGFNSIVQASNSLITAKRMFARNLRSLVAKYVRDEKAVELEIAELLGILSHAGAELSSSPRSNYKKALKPQRTELSQGHDFV